MTNARDFEAAKLEANHTQAVNLVINGPSELNSKLKQFSDSINQKLEGYLANNQTIYQPLQQCNNQGNMNCFQNQLHPSSSIKQQWQQKMRVCHYCSKQGHLKIDFSNFELPIQSSTILTDLPANNATANISTTHILTFSLSITATSNISITAATNNLSNICTVKIMTAEFRNWVYLKPKFSELFKSFGYPKRHLIQQPGTQTKATTYQQYSTSHHYKR
ncbi:hypothetical protein G9A89_013656 [Geosiphon pyriformis]|nr:hypothetical protein G9A89_013656 [Geosiphon pyriformis]